MLSLADNILLEINSDELTITINHAKHNIRKFYIMPLHAQVNIADYHSCHIFMGVEGGGEGWRRDRRGIGDPRSSRFERTSPQKLWAFRNENIDANKYFFYVFQNLRNKEGEIRVKVRNWGRRLYAPILSLSEYSVATSLHILIYRYIYFFTLGMQMNFQ